MSKNNVGVQVVGMATSVRVGKVYGISGAPHAPVFDFNKSKRNHKSTPFIAKECGKCKRRYCCPFDCAIRIEIKPGDGFIKIKKSELGQALIEMLDPPVRKMLARTDNNKKQAELIHRCKLAYVMQIKKRGASAYRINITKAWGRFLNNELFAGQRGLN